jgi:hypothetical protein
VRVRGARRNDVLHPHHFSAGALARQLARRFELVELGARWEDPLCGPRRGHVPYPLGGLANRIKRAARLYAVGRPRARW